MTYYHLALLSFSVFIGTAIGWLKIRKTDGSILPFLLCLTIASFNEIVSFFVTISGYHTNVNNNIYVLSEGLLLTWQFKRWGLFAGYRKSYYDTLVFLLTLWVAENAIATGFCRIQSYFRIGYSLALVLMSIHMNSRLILKARGTLLKSPPFLICTGFIIYFTYKILVEIFWFYGLNASRDFRMNVYLLLVWLNFFVNLLYALALLWKPAKPRFLRLY